MIDILSRAPNDDFTFDLFQDLLSGVDKEFESYYIWSNPPPRLKFLLENTEFEKPNVVIGIKDLLDQWKHYNPWDDATQAGTKLIEEMANRFPDKNFIIFTSLENIKTEQITAKNVQFLCWGGDITNQAKSYPSIKPVIEKNFRSKKTFICLNRNAREHRIVTLSYLFGRGYDHCGYITFLGDKPGPTDRPFDLLDILPWDFESIQADFFVDNREVIKQGFDKFYSTDLASDVYDIYESDNDNVTNFDKNLRWCYKNSFIEIVNESSFATPGYNLTEKTLNSFYACNFPIVLGGVGIVQLLRDIGFDMFDDVINHNYDNILNPFNRIINAIECNKELLINGDLVKQKWQDNQERFLHNIEVAKTKLYPWYEQRLRTEFAQLQWQ